MYSFLCLLALAVELAVDHLLLSAQHLIEEPQKMSTSDSTWHCAEENKSCQLTVKALLLILF